MLEAATPGTTGHPYQRYEMLNKIMKNLTVRSNVFAVWMTVGFFEVQDDTTLPVALGAEVGRSENRHIRHRMFAIVDRTHLQMGNTTLKAAVDGGTITVTPGETIRGTPNFVVRDIDGPNGVLKPIPRTNAASNLQWTVQAGTMLTVSPNGNGEETVTVFQGATQLQARFFRNHGAGAAVIIRGNSGPHFRYNPRADTNVVPHFAVID
jgi:hypothetical protein